MIRWKRRRGVERSDLRRALTTFRPALRGQSGAIASAVGFALATTALELAKPWPVTLVIDHLVLAPVAGAAADEAAAPGLTIVELGLIGALAALALLVPVLLGHADERLQITVARVSRKATVRIRSDVFAHAQRMELREHQQLFRGDLLIRLMGDVNMIRDLLFPSWLTLLSRGSVLVGAGIVFALVDWRLFLVALIPVPLLWLSVERGAAAVRNAAGRQRRKEGAIAARAAESLRQVGLVKAFAAEDRITEEFRSDARRAERATMAATREAARMSRLAEILTGGGVALVLLFGTLRARSGLLSPGELVLVLSYTRMMYKPIRKLSNEGARLAKATACARRVMDLLDRPTEDPNRGRPAGRLDGDIELHGVHHRYPDGRVSIADLSVRFPAGRSVLVTGENGSGKSTLLSLLLRLHAPSAGTISVGGIPIDEIRLDEYRASIAFSTSSAATAGATATTARPATSTTSTVATTRATTSTTRATTSTTRATTSSSSTSTTAASTTTSSAPTTALSETRTFNVVGGSTAISFSASGVTVLWASPNPGFDVDIEPEGSGIRVEFESEDHRSRVDAWWSGGPQHRIREDADD